MVFTSYGGLIPGQSERDFFSCSSMPRNRELMRVFKDVGLVEQLGSGMSRILKVYDKSIFHITDHFIKVEFPFSMPVNTTYIANGDINGDIKQETTIEDRVLALIEEKPSITAAQLAEVTKVSTRKISRIMKDLRESGMIVRIGSNKTGHWEVHKK